LQLNVTALAELTWLFARSMAARGRGPILNVASTGAYLPVPYYAAHAAGKAFVRNFSEAAAYELAPRGVSVCRLAPGETATEFQAVAGQAIAAGARARMMSADRCAEIGLRALFHGRRVVSAHRQPHAQVSGLHAASRFPASTGSRNAFAAFVTSSRVVQAS
jgi:hypothetical protein